MPYFIKSRDRTDEFLTPEVTVLRASLPFSRSVLCVGDCEGRTGGLAMVSGSRAKETERARGIHLVIRNKLDSESTFIYIYIA